MGVSVREDVEWGSVVVGNGSTNQEPQISPRLLPEVAAGSDQSVRVLWALTKDELRAIAEAGNRPVRCEGLHNGC